MIIGCGAITLPSCTALSGGGVNFSSLFTPGTVLQSVQSDLGITSAGGFVSQWNDQSGNGLHYTQGTGASRPALTAGLNGNPGLLFDGVDDSLLSSLTLPRPGTTPTWHGFVFRQTAWLASRAAPTGNGSAGSAMVLYTNPSSPSIRLNSSLDSPINDAAPPGTWVCGEGYSSNSASDYFRLASTTVVGVFGNGSGTENGRAIGSNAGVGFGPVEVLAAIYLNVLPSAPQIAAWRAAVTAKYGVSVQV